MRALLEAQMPFLTDAQKAQFLTYYEMLIDWNTRMNLTAVTDAEAVVQKHFLDSLAAEPLLPHGARVIDVGTGAGFLGVPLAILRPDVKLTLLDSRSLRAYARGGRGARQSLSRVVRYCAFPRRIRPARARRADHSAFEGRRRQHCV